VLEIDDVGSRPPCQRMQRRHCNHDTDREQQTPVELIVARPERQGQVDLAALDEARSAGAALFDETDVDAWTRPQVPRQERRQDALDHLRRASDPKAPDLAAAHRVCMLGELVDTVEELAAPAQEGFAFARQANPTPGALEEPNAELRLGWFIQAHEGVRLVWHYGYWPESFSSLYLKRPERKIALIVLANRDGLSAPFLLGAGDVTRSPFANSFLRIFVHEERVGHALPDPRWSQSNEGFKAELAQLAPPTGGYRYDLERASHDLLTRWLDERRRAR
jgi:beta-lactamase family protein